MLAFAGRPLPPGTLSTTRAAVRFVPPPQHPVASAAESSATTAERRCLTTLAIPAAASWLAARRRGRRPPLTVNTSRSSSQRLRATSQESETINTSRRSAASATAAAVAMTMADIANAAGDKESGSRYVTNGAASQAPGSRRPGRSTPVAGPTLKGRYAVVTGATAGIGKGIAVGLGELGATVFVTGRRKELLQQTAELVTRAGGKGVAIVCDHSDDKQVESAFKEVERQSGGNLDILVNNAFKAPDADPEIDKKFTAGAKFYELPLSVWDDMHTVGLRSHYVSSYYAAPMMIRTAASTARRPLICVTSSFGAVSYLFTTAYGVGKAASDRLVRDLQVELGPLGIDCLTVWPGLVLTEKVLDLWKNTPSRIDRITGGVDPYLVGESPLLSGRVVAQLAANEKIRNGPPLITPDGLTGRVCIVAEAAQDLALRDGGLILRDIDGNILDSDLYGSDRRPAPSIRSLGFLGPGPLRNALPDQLKGLAAPGGPLASYDVRLPLEFMAQGPPPPPPRASESSVAPLTAQPS